MRLPSRSPGAALEALPDIVPTPDRREALDDMDQWRGKYEVTEQELKVRDQDIARVTRERDDLSVRVLPMRGLPWHETDEPPGTPIGDELADKHGGWPE